MIGLLCNVAKILPKTGKHSKKDRKTSENYLNHFQENLWQQ